MMTVSYRVSFGKWSSIQAFCSENLKEERKKLEKQFSRGPPAVVGLVVSVRAFYSDYWSSNPADVYNFSCTIAVEKNKIKRGREWPILRK